MKSDYATIEKELLRKERNYAKAAQNQMRKEEKQRLKREAQKKAAAEAEAQKKVAPAPIRDPRAPFLQKLGVVSDTPAAIRSAYRRMALRYHPDKNKDPRAPAMFREMKDAYDALMG